MPDTGNVNLRLLSLDGKLVKDVTTKVRFKRDNKTIPFSRTFSTGRETFAVETFHKAWQGEVQADRFQPRNAGFFLVQVNQTIERDVWLPRDLSEKVVWNAIFTTWNRLDDTFQPLKTVLSRSPQIVPRRRKKGGGFDVAPTRSFAEAEYDNVDNELVRLAKAGLLNLYSKLMDAPVPPGSPAWFTMIERILVLQPDRIIAIVTPQMRHLVRKIWEDSTHDPHYLRAPAKNHTANVPKEFQVQNIFSLKSHEKIGGLQLTISDVETSALPGQQLAILDTDIDENGKALKHFGDFIKHKFTRGTHAFDIHDILHTISRRTGKPLQLGYELA
jgi:hypothetical protein